MVFLCFNLLEGANCFKQVGVYWIISLVPKLIFFSRWGEQLPTHAAQLHLLPRAFFCHRPSELLGETIWTFWSCTNLWFQVTDSLWQMEALESMDKCSFFSSFGSQWWGAFYNDEMNVCAKFPNSIKSQIPTVAICLKIHHCVGFLFYHVFLLLNLHFF